MKYITIQKLLILGSVCIGLVGCNNRQLHLEDYGNIHTQQYPPHGVAGKCYAKTLLPAVYNARSKRVLMVPQSYRYVNTPASYRTVRKSVLLSPARTEWKNRGRSACTTSRNVGNVVCLEQKPARYRYVNERVMDRAASTKKIVIPAQYRSMTQRIKVRDERLVWKEVMCGNSSRYSNRYRDTYSGNMPRYAEPNIWDTHR
jgi:hypothetical protein